MNESSWKTFLTEYNRELLSYEEVVERLSPELIKAANLGYAGATEEEIVAAEKHLVANLPRSFRAFLKVSNGWRFPSVSIFNLLPATRIAWFQEENQAWIDTYVHTASESPPISDEEYFVYGGNQDSVNFRAEYLQTALQISEVGDSGVVLLNPKVVTPAGEWETWFFANWLPGAQRYRSFEEWLAAERLNCRNQFKTLPRAQLKKIAAAKKPRSVRKAVEAVRNGQIEIAIEALESFAAKGETIAAAPLAELYAFLGQWDKAIGNAGRSLALHEGLHNDFVDMVKLLGCAGHHSGEWNRIIEVVETAIKANTNRNYDKYHEYIRDSHDKVFRNLIEYAKRRGKPPHELIAIFPLPDHLKHLQQPTNISQEQRETKYQHAVKIANSIPFLKTPHDRAEHIFKLMQDVWDDKAMELYESHGANFLMGWEAAEYVARIYVQRKNPDAAWAVIASNICKWSGYLPPIVLLTDEYLSTLMTPERCQFILSTPRGPEAAKAVK